MSKRSLHQQIPGGNPGGPVPWLPPSSGDILLVTGNSLIREETERIAAAAGATLSTAKDATEAAPVWDRADVVLLGSDVREIPPRRRPPAVLLGLAGESEDLWQLAAALGAERVAVLPDAAPWLAEHLSGSRSPDPGGLVLGVTGGCGGAGASTVAVWLAQAAARHGARSILVDGDPWGGGIELSLAAEDVPGLRWPDLAEARGSIDPGQLADSLPVTAGLSFLSWPGTRTRTAAAAGGAAAAVLEAARRSFEVVIVDIGRTPESLHSFAWDCDKVLLLVAARLKPAVAAARLLNELPPVETGLVVRAGAGSALEAPLIADLLGLPLQGILPEIRSTAAAAEAGQLLDLGRRRAVRRFTESVLGLVDGGAR